MEKQLFQLGSHINRNGWRGKVIAIGWLGERYYWLLQDDGVVAMIPAAVLD